KQFCLPRTVISYLQHKPKNALIQLPVKQRQKQRCISDKKIIGAVFRRIQNGSIQRKKEKTDKLGADLTKCKNCGIFSKFFASAQINTTFRELGFGVLPFQQHC